MSNKFVIRQWIFDEVNRPISVEKHYPLIQWDEFEYTYPFKEGGLSGWDKLGIMASTIYDNTLYYEYYVLDREYYEHKDTAYKQLKEILIKRINEK